MNGSLKIGAVSGLVAGFVVAIIAVFFSIPLIYELGFRLVYFSPPPELHFTEIASNEIINDLLWGAILGVIFWKAYSIIPGKGISKGLVYGLLCYLFYSIRWASFFIIYWYPNWIVLHFVYGLFRWIPYGLLLGFLHEYLHSRYVPAKEEPKIVTYDMGGGFYPGAIAGLLAGIATFIAHNMYTYGILELFGVKFVRDLSFVISQLGGQIMWHMVWGIGVGLLFPKAYNLVPGKGIIKGLYYSLIAQLLFLELQGVSWLIGYGDFAGAHTVFFSGITQSIVYGLVLGALYRR